MYAALLADPRPSAAKPHVDAQSGPAPSGAAAEDALHLAQLLCARLCHDLVGAAGAISNGVELLGDAAADTADIHDLLGLSGRQLNRRLAFYRRAFALNPSRDGRSSLAEARRLAADYLAESRVSLQWRDSGLGDGGAEGDDTDAAVLVRVLLCAIMVAAEGLRRGGELTVTLGKGAAGVSLLLEATGCGAELSQPVRAALDPHVATAAITARTVPAYYLAGQARTLGWRAEAVPGCEGFSLRIAAPVS